MFALPSGMCKRVGGEMNSRSRPLLLSPVHQMSWGIPSLWASVSPSAMRLGSAQLLFLQYRLPELTSILALIQPGVQSQPCPSRNNGWGWASQSWPQTQSPRAHPGLFSAVGDGVRKGFSTPSTMAALDHCPAVTRRSACPKIASLPLLLGCPHLDVASLLAPKGCCEAAHESPGRQDWLESVFPPGRDPGDGLAA